jgi:DNA-directed RNA polymerase subunit beta'
MGKKGILPFDAIKLMIASPEEILSWSHGEVKKPETLNYRTLKPEKDGLFCAKIFGPIKDYECLCGKYKGKKYEGTICDRCGVEVTRSYVRRERFGHIDLAAPVSHIWFLKSSPSKIASLLNLSTRDAERVIYFENYLVIEYPTDEEEAEAFEKDEKTIPLNDFGETKWVKLHIVNEDTYQNEYAFSLEDKYEAGIGAEIVKEVLSKLDLEAYAEKLKRLIEPYSLSWEDLNAETRERFPKYYEKMVRTIASYFQRYGIEPSDPKTIDELIIEQKWINPKTGEIAEEQLTEDFVTGLEALEKIYDYYRSRNSELPIIEKLKEEVRQTVIKAFPESKIKDYIRKLQLIEGFINSGNKPEWMILEVLPVIPPELRPLVLLEGGRFATSDLNDLYRRVINRNNRLKRLIELDAPEIIIRNEKRMLQESVDALLDNGKRGKVVTAKRRPLKSLADYLKGKQGRFRQNLLGKRVDYSGRSVIVVGPELKMHQCGLPKIMALELFKPFLYRRLEEKGYATSIKQAKKLVKEQTPEVWECLEEVVKQHPVLLNRAPTLHRPSIQAFEPVLVEGKAIKLHPLVCPPFNADFDGDQMAVHVPLGIEPQLESYILMLSTQQVLSPAHGKPLTMPSQDMILGVNYITQVIEGVKGEGKIFASADEAIKAWELGKLDIHARIKVKYNGQVVETTVGRILFNEILPEEYKQKRGFVNQVLTKKNLAKFIYDVYKVVGNEETVNFLDRLKTLGFELSTKAAVSIGMDDIRVPKKKKEIVERAMSETAKIWEQYRKGIITNKERYNRIIDVWSRATEEITQEMFKEIEQTEIVYNGKKFPGTFNSIYMMAMSGARGNKDQVRQLAGTRGLMAKHSGEFIETPIISSFKEGLSVLEYFISTYGARKGLADTALKTAQAGYLTRRLVDAVQEVRITEEDCGTIKGITVEPIIEGGEVKLSLKDRIFGRIAAEDVKDPISGEILVKAGELIDDEKAEKIERAGVEKVKVRSVLTCEAKGGVCAKCYGMDLSNRRLVSVGEAVGIIAAQSIGEPGTQLTMRTFHIGGAATAERIRSELIVEHNGILKYHNIKYVVNREGKKVVTSKQGQVYVQDKEGHILERHPVPHGATLLVDDGQEVKAGQKVAEWNPFADFIIAEVKGKLVLTDIIKDVTIKEERDPITGKISLIVSFMKPKDAMLHTPRITIVGEDGKEYVYDLPVNAALMIPREKLKLVWKTCPTCTEAEGTEIQHQYFEPVEDIIVEPGDILARLPKETAKVKDIVGGLPKVEELFEARPPKNPAILTEIDGEVKIYEDADEIIIFNPFTKETWSHKVAKDELILVKAGRWVKKGEPITDKTKAEIEGRVQMTSKGYKVIVYNRETGLEKEYFVPKGKYLQVKDGDRVRAGDPLTDGTPNSHEILRIKGVEELQKFLIKEVQLVYRLQGVDIHDKHFEIIVRQMLRKVRITDPGDSHFIVREIVDREDFEEEIKRLKEQGKKLPKAEPVLVGITKSALHTKSWISAASFQETTKVLTDAACEGKVDELRGLKENVIIGNLVPVGTGEEIYSKVQVEPVGQPEVGKELFKEEPQEGSEAQ